MKIFIANVSTEIEDAEIQSWMPAFERYTHHIREYWPRTTFTLYFVKPNELPVDAWQILYMDDSDAPGALGYHDYTPTGKPISKIFVRTCERHGYSVPVVTTHEIAEMIADPFICDVMQVSNTTFYAKEICDAVQSEEFAYTIKSHGEEVLVSNFQTGAWFLPGHPGPVYDKMGVIKEPLEIAAGGYMSVYECGHGWTQIDENSKRATIEHPRSSRPDKYMKDRGGDLSLAHLFE